MGSESNMRCDNIGKIKNGKLGDLYDKGVGKV